MAYRKPELKPSIVKILSGENAIGNGFLISDKHIITCAHVVARALDISEYGLEIPREDVDLVFPFIRDANKLAAKVIKWFPCDPKNPVPNNLPQDVAILCLNSSLPMSAKPAILRRDNSLWEHKCAVFGSPSGDGDWTEVQTLDFVADGGCVQIRGVTDLGHFVTEGYSGSPVWDCDIGDVIGMIVAKENLPNTRTAYAIPVSELSELFADLHVHVYPAKAVLKGIPTIICAMTSEQCSEFSLDIKTNLDNIEKEGLPGLAKVLAQYELTDLQSYYGNTQEEWCPPIADGIAISTIIDYVFDLYNKYQERIYQDRVSEDDQDFSIIYPEFMSEWFFSLDPITRLHEYEKLKTNGCLFIIDAISLFYKQIHDIFISAHFDSMYNERISILILPPIDQTKTEVHKFLESEMRKELVHGFRYFEREIRSLFEFSISDARHLKRWLYSIIPQAINSMKITPLKLEKKREALIKAGMDHQKLIYK